MLFSEQERLLEYKILSLNLDDVLSSIALRLQA